MRTFFIFYISLSVVFTCCKNRASVNITESKRKQSPAKDNFQTDSRPFLDTLIVLTQLNNSNFDNSSLTQKKAMACLYSFFKDKGILSRHEQSKHKKYEERLCVDYDTIYEIQTRKFSGAVISYWLGTIDLNGHCFQPQKAIIRHTQNGYKITDQNFVSTNFAIDSTLVSNIYGFDYDCGGKGVLRHFNITLK